MWPSLPGCGYSLHGLPVLAAGAEDKWHCSALTLTFFFSPAFIVSNDPSSHFQGVLDRFSQIQPKLIFSVEAVVYNGKEHGHLEKLQRVVKGTWGPALGACTDNSWV